MKKTLITTAVAIALGASFSVNADQTDTINTENLLGATNTTVGATAGKAATSKNSAKDSYNTSAVGSLNDNISHGFNDVNSNNLVNIGEDGIVAYAQDLDQAVASSDLNHAIGSAGIAGTGAANNLIAINSARSVAALSPASQASTGNTWTSTNTVSAGSFNNFGGTSSASQNVGNMTAVGQSIVVQSNGGV